MFKKYIAGLMITLISYLSYANEVKTFIRIKLMKKFLIVVLTLFLATTVQAGDGSVQEEFNEAITLAEGGNADAQYRIGTFYFEHFYSSRIREIKRDVQKAYSWFLKAAKQGHVDAQYRLGILLAVGGDDIGIKGDDQKSYSWYLKAAKQGHVVSQYRIGRLYSIGKGVKKDSQKAYSWYLKAAKRDHVDSQLIVSGMYFMGEGVKQNKIKAKEWSSKVCDAGERKGCQILRYINEQEGTNKVVTQPFARGDGIDGPYTDTIGFVKYEFVGNGSLTMTMKSSGEVVKAEYKIDGDKLTISDPKGARSIILTILKDGTFEGPLGLHLKPVQQ